MVKLIDGKKIAERIKDKIAQEIYSKNGPRPNLAIILIGEREDSKLYVSLKEKEGKRVGIDTHLYLFNSDVSQNEILQVIGFLNKDKTIDGILVQLPLPKKFNTNKIISTILPEKDVDGFHPQKPDYIIPPVLAAVGACLDEISLNGQEKKACLMYNSDTFGGNLTKFLQVRGFSFYPQKESVKADLIVSALGKPQTIKKEMIKEKAVIIDIGITKKDKKVLGDVDFLSIKDKASYITPVPGGIGPMTIAFLFKNVLEIFNRHQK